MVSASAPKRSDERSGDLAGYVSVHSWLGGKCCAPGHIVRSAEPEEDAKTIVGCTNGAYGMRTDRLGILRT